MFENIWNYCFLKREKYISTTFFAVKISYMICVQHFYLKKKNWLKIHDNCLICLYEILDYNILYGIL